MCQTVEKEAYGTISMKLHSLHHQPDFIITNTNNSITSAPISSNHTQPTHTFTTAIMKFSVATVLALAAAAFATPTPGGGFGGHGGRFGNVYSTDDNDAIIDIDISVDLRSRINDCDRGSIWGDGWWGEDYGRGLRYDADEFCRDNDRVHGIWGCTEPCDV